MRLLAVLLACLALAGCGSTTSAGGTKTVTVTKTNTAQVDACKQAILSLLNSSKMLTKATQIYVSQLRPAYAAGAYGQSVDGITAKIRTGTGYVRRATALMQAAEPYATECRG